MNIRNILFDVYIIFCIAIVPLRSLANVDSVKDSVVHILGATEGTGVIIGRRDSSYQVVTAWHVLASNHRSEELWIVTADGSKYLIPLANVVKLQGIDMAILTFKSNGNYPIVPIANSKISHSGSLVAVAGWPLGSPIVRITSGTLIASADVGIDNGYALLYTNDTLPGMSGGAVVNQDGYLLGIHGRGEQNEEEIAGSFKTGINQGMPAYFLYQYLNGQETKPRVNTVSSCDDYLAYARSVLDLPNSASTILKFAEKAVDTCLDKGYPYFLKALAYHTLGKRANAIDYYQKAYSSGLISATLLSNLAANRLEVALIDGGQFDPAQVYNELLNALELDPSNINALYNLQTFLRIVGKHSAAREVIINALSMYSAEILFKEALKEVDLEIKGGKHGAVAD